MKSIKFKKIGILFLIFVLSFGLLCESFINYGTTRVVAEEKDETFEELKKWVGNPDRLIKEDGKYYYKDGEEKYELSTPAETKKLADVGENLELYSDRNLVELSECYLEEDKAPKTNNLNCNLIFKGHGKLNYDYKNLPIKIYDTKGEIGKLNVKENDLDLILAHFCKDSEPMYEENEITLKLFRQLVKDFFMMMGLPIKDEVDGNSIDRFIYLVAPIKNKSLNYKFELDGDTVIENFKTDFGVSKIEIPDEVVDIKEKAFEGSNFEEISLPWYLDSKQNPDSKFNKEKVFGELMSKKVKFRIKPKPSPNPVPEPEPKPEPTPVPVQYPPQPNPSPKPSPNPGKTGDPGITAVSVIAGISVFMFALILRKRDKI